MTKKGIILSKPVCKCLKNAFFLCKNSLLSIKKRLYEKQTNLFNFFFNDLLTYFLSVWFSNLFPSLISIYCVKLTYKFLFFSKKKWILWIFRMMAGIWWQAAMIIRLRFMIWREGRRSTPTTTRTTAWIWCGSRTTISVCCARARGTDSIGLCIGLCMIIIYSAASWVTPTSSRAWTWILKMLHFYQCRWTGRLGYGTTRRSSAS